MRRPIDSGYDALACMGREAQPALPYLLEKSADDDKVVAVLGELAPYYPQTIVPRLIQLLDHPARAGAAASALGRTGSGARQALDALRSHLAIAVSGNQDALAAELLPAVGKVGDPATTVPELLPLLDKPGTCQAAAQTLGEIGPPAAAVPRLIARLEAPEIDPKERYGDITALGAIDSHSHQLLDVLLREAVSDKDAGGNINAASILSKIDPLPRTLRRTWSRPCSRYPRKEVYEASSSWHSITRTREVMWWARRSYPHRRISMAR